MLVPVLALALVVPLAPSRISATSWKRGAQVNGDRKHLNGQWEVARRTKLTTTIMTIQIAAPLATATATAMSMAMAMATAMDCCMHPHLLWITLPL